MGNRLSVIATRTGDDGTTGLADGTRRGKQDVRIAALGDVDELNSVIGVLRACCATLPVDADLAAIQHDLFDLGAELSIPGHAALSDSRIVWLDERLAHYNADLPALREFILPAGSPGVAQAHVARSVCRRAERTVVTLAQDEQVAQGARLYLNRLSDLLFVLARSIARLEGTTEVYWKSPQARAT